MPESMPKCIALQTDSGIFQFSLNGNPIPESQTVCDLGVTSSADPKFRGDVATIAEAVARVSGLPLHCFVIHEPALYARLYRTLIVPRLLYCAPVRSPSLICDIKLCARICLGSVRIVALRCNVTPESIDSLVPQPEHLHRDADLRAFIRIVRSGSLNVFFDTRSTILSLSHPIEPNGLARNPAVQNLFVWRVARKHRTQPSLCNKETSKSVSEPSTTIGYYSETPCSPHDSKWVVVS